MCIKLCPIGLLHLLSSVLFGQLSASVADIIPSQHPSHQSASSNYNSQSCEQVMTSIMTSYINICTQYQTTFIIIPPSQDHETYSCPLPPSPPFALAAVSRLPDLLAHHCFLRKLHMVMLLHIMSLYKQCISHVAGSAQILTHVIFMRC